MKHKIILTLFSLLILVVTNAQNIGIGTTNPDPSAILDITASNKGLLIPRTSYFTQNFGILNPAKGLMVYDTTTSSFWYHNGSAWVEITSGGLGWLTTGNNSTSSAINFIGTTDAQPLIFKVNGQKAGILDYDNLKGNTGFGYDVLLNTTGALNTANGYKALFNDAGGYYNTAEGAYALQSNTQGYVNTAIGYLSLNSDTTGVGNTAIGFGALSNDKDGIKNTSIGFNSLSNNYNGSNITAIGAQADVMVDGLTNATAIGAGAQVGMSNALVLGYNVNVGIGTSTPAATFNVAAGKTVLFGTDFTSSENKLMWLPSKAAFRVGNYPGLVNDTIGYYSTAMGVSLASGLASTAMGASLATAQDATAMGESSAKGKYSTAMGNSTAFGQFSMATGLGLAEADYSTAMGTLTVANSQNETVIGIYNDTSDLYPRLFEVGNGISDVFRSNALTVLYDGNVGIGNSNPSLAGLIVDKKVGAANAMFGSNTTGVTIESSWPGIALNTYYNSARKFIATGYGGLVSLNESNGDMAFYTYGSGTSGTAISSSKGFAFSNGSNSLYPLNDNAYTLGTSGARWSTVYAVNGTIQTSDVRLKKDINPSSYGLKQIMQLQPVTYNWKDGSNQQPMLGLLAQDVKKIIPEAVVGNEQKEYLGIKYDALIPVLIKGMQELKQKTDEIEILKKENADMKQKEDDMQAQLDKLNKVMQQLQKLQ